MKILNVGSLNIDYVYQVAHFVQPGETIASLELNNGCGGKGLNQSVALARGRRAHGPRRLRRPGTGCFCFSSWRQRGSTYRGVRVTDAVSGHAVIQVDAAGQNAILLYPGTNHALTREDIAAALAGCAAGDWLLVQNETNGLEDLLRGRRNEVCVSLSTPPPSPRSWPGCRWIWWTVSCSTKSRGRLCPAHRGPRKCWTGLRSRYPRAQIVLTLGENGVRYWDGKTVFAHPIFQVPVVDTTAAGDTFTGYFLAGLTKGLPAQDILRLASGAAALAVSRKGAAASIPTREETESFLRRQG